MTEANNESQGQSLTRIRNTLRTLINHNISRSSTMGILTHTSNFAHPKQNWNLSYKRKIANVMESSS